MTAKAIGQRGSWFATVEGERLPCVHRFWLKGLLYDDPHVEPNQQWDELIDAINLIGRVILTNDDPIDGGLGFSRTGYIAEYEVDDVAVEGSHLRFRLTRRLRDLK